jgi:choline monooxygenase
MREPEDLFSPAHYAAVRRPVGEAFNLPPWCYTSPRFFEREIELVFGKVWNFVGRAERIARPGDFFTVDAATVPLLIVRGADGEARAFANTCRHRGCAVARGEGNTRAFVCPYHSWTYSSSGELLSAPTDMSECTGFDMKDYSLIPVRLETWAGFMFVNMDKNAPSLRAYLGNLPELLQDYDCANMTLGRRLEFDVNCNWKFYVENLKDPLHVTTVHRNSISKFAPVKKYWREVQKTNGNMISTFMGYPASAMLFPDDEGFAPIKSLDMEKAGTTAPLIFPNLYVACTVDGAWYIHVNPVAADRIKLEQGALFPRESLARSDRDEVLKRYFRRLDMTQAEDNEICALQHKGLNSPLSRPGRYSTKEALVHQTVNWILDRVLGEQTHPR